ncbi:hypothetical protein GCM10009789_82270 [Kribbella sancticallisti]|uniref:Uncharacterized protein n=2 Tax=Kribbella sancticallisti TaxID=460087 RepID=A0ABN2ERW3_9ACTN
MLISGDRVEMRGPRPPAVQAGPGRAGMRFHIHKEAGDTYVMPYDAASLVTAGRIDRRLFNATKLAELGYNDLSRKDIPLIVTGNSEDIRAVKADRQGGQDLAGRQGEGHAGPKRPSGRRTGRLAVGAVDNSDQLAMFSSRGPLKRHWPRSSVVRSP